MICKACRKRADSKTKPGCTKPCKSGCDCQHKAVRAKPEPATGPPGE